ncbi:MAG: hypothetical protein ACK53W_12665 [Gemmatimonadota bacterium]|jgi:hypothetical protein
MPNALYGRAKQKFLNPGTLGSTSSSSIDLIDDTIRVALVDLGTYTFNADHEFFSSVSSAVVGTPVDLTSKTVDTSGVFDAADPTFTGVSGASVEALVIYKWTGSNATSSLIAFIDTATSGLPVTPNGGDITVQFSASGIFAL